MNRPPNAQAKLRVLSEEEASRQLQPGAGQPFPLTISEGQSVLDDYHVAVSFSTLAIAEMVFQLRIVAGTPKTRSSVLK
jgi:hypothetical protein